VKERKTIIITIVVAVIVSCILITLFFIINNNNLNNDTNFNNKDNDSLLLDNVYPDNNINSPEEEIYIQDSLSVNEIMLEAKASDPIYGHLREPYKSDTYTLSLSVDANLITYLTITINTSEPTSAQGRSVVEGYKYQALQQIRDWGVDPDNYDIYVTYRY